MKRFVVIGLGNFGSSVDQCGEPVLIETFITEFAIEALDVTVLHWPARLVNSGGLSVRTALG